jgi:hypothetical protein
VRDLQLLSAGLYLCLCLRRLPVSACVIVCEYPDSIHVASDSLKRAALENMQQAMSNLRKQLASVRTARESEKERWGREGASEIEK